MTAEERIRRFIVEELSWQGTPAELADDTSLIDSGILDSLGILKMISFLESDFGIKIQDDEILPRNFETIGSITAFVERGGSS